MTLQQQVRIKDGSATLSPDGRYRYFLSRTWGGFRRQVLFVMLNPSTADAAIDDATVRSCKRIAKANEFGSLSIVNLFAWRATKPHSLVVAAQACGDIVGEDNDSVLGRTMYGFAVNGYPIVAAWGAPNSAPLRAIVAARVAFLRDLCQRRDMGLCHLGLTADGSPRHPLYLPTATRVTAWNDWNREVAA